MIVRKTCTISLIGATEKVYVAMNIIMSRKTDQLMSVKPVNLTLKEPLISTPFSTKQENVFMPQQFQTVIQPAQA